MASKSKQFDLSQFWERQVPERGQTPNSAEVPEDYLEADGQRVPPKRWSSKNNGHVEHAAAIPGLHDCNHFVTAPAR